ncbi:hypothetical protein C8Q77DRAFT_421757 [Trametes polyzona]|nr:hypothetical protein C8Q77DRAFT_421757 [Trametes polyzona]
MTVEKSLRSTSGSPWVLRLPRGLWSSAVRGRMSVPGRQAGTGLMLLFPLELHFSHAQIQLFECSMESPRTPGCTSIARGRTMFIAEGSNEVRAISTHTAICSCVSQHVLDMGEDWTHLDLQLRLDDDTCPKSCASLKIQNSCALELRIGYYNSEGRVTEMGKDKGYARRLFLVAGGGYIKGILVPTLPRTLRLKILLTEGE